MNETMSDSSSVLDRESVNALVAKWTALWNGDLAVADDIIDADNRVHAALFDGRDDSELGGIDGMKALVTQLRSLLPDLGFSVEVGPIAEGDHIALRWLADGHYAGGMPGAAAPPGTAVSFNGADFLRVEAGKVAEYWLDADSLALVSQLRVGSAG